MVSKGRQIVNVLLCTLTSIAGCYPAGPPAPQFGPPPPYGSPYGPQTPPPAPTTATTLPYGLPNLPPGFIPDGALNQLPNMAPGILPGVLAQIAEIPDYIPHVTGPQGQPIIVPSQPPGSLAVFPHPDALPQRIFLSRHVEVSGVAPVGQVMTMMPVVEMFQNLSGRHGLNGILPAVAFVVPSLAPGVYDAWYLDGHPTRPLAPLVRPADARASQSMTFAILPPKVQLPRISEQVFSSIRSDALQVGDVLLFVGKSPVVSSEIIEVEATELGPHAPTYSHAALYAGNSEVIEMLSHGWRKRSLRESIDDHNISIDVYRRRGMTIVQGQEVIRRAISYAPNGHLRYAAGQIATMMHSHFSRWSSITRAMADVTDLVDEGKEAMICSELVAWAYFESGLSLSVPPWWGSVVRDQLLTSINRRMDYTTPNMLAHSPDLARQFTLYQR